MHKWFEEADLEKPNIVSSRIRLVRNWNEYVFPSKLSEEESYEVISRLHDSLQDLGEIDGKHYEYADLKELSDLDRRALRERRILNTSILEKKLPTAMILSEEEDVCLILNGMDHIRLQVLASGLHLHELWKKADQMDDYINARFPYAFDERYGYLTSFPTNVGTGMRASVVIHLPMLSLGKKFSGMLADMGRFGIAVKGVYGEGRDNYGSLYEISNQKTMGQTEKELIDLVIKVTNRLNDQENQVREIALQNHRLEREDEVYKSYGVLKYARRLSMKDAMTFLSQLMLGMSDGLIQLQEPCAVYRLMLGIQEANLQKISDRPLGKEELDMARASYLRMELPDIQ
ncbi:MAG: ATP--guanido phosphotransferase [Hungatella sp.]